MTGLFFTGTDTGVGKTHVAASAARLLRRQEVPVWVSKPVASGAAWAGGRWLAEDTRRLGEAAGVSPAQWTRVTPWTFPEPAAPPVAARLLGVTLSLADLAAAVAPPGLAPETLVLVEGVGGILCPLTEGETVADLAAVLGLPLVVVARRALGTLNHTLLTVEAALRRGLRVTGVVVNETSSPGSIAEETNVEELRRRLPVPVLAVVPYQDEDPASLAAIPWQRLAGPLN